MTDPTPDAAAKGRSKSAGISTLAFTTLPGAGQACQKK